MSGDWALFRIDDRLIHGQVVSVWVPELKVKRILIIDDIVAQDPFLQKIYQLSAPPGINIDVYSVDQAANEVLLHSGHSNTLVVIRSPQTLYRLISKGFPVKSVNIGALGSTPERHLFYRNICLSKPELDMLRDMQKSGLKIYFQRTPDEPIKYLEPA